MSTKIAHTFPSMTPPRGFTVVEFGSLYRTLDTIEGEHLAYLKRLRLGSILVLTPTSLDNALLSFLENEEIAVHFVLSSSRDTSPLGPVPFGALSIGVSEDWMKSTLELLFKLSRDPVLIVGSNNTCVDATMIACLRRVQRWSLTSVLEYFRQLTGRKIFDLEQFIEFFDTSIVRIPQHRMPVYLDMFLKIQNFEVRGCKDQSAEGNEILRSEVGGKEKKKVKEDDREFVEVSSNDIKDHILRYDDWNNQQQLCITSLTQFDPSISLITDDVTDE